MADEDWVDGTFYDDQGEFAVARIRYCLRRNVEADGHLLLTGDFLLQEEYSPLHTGMAQLIGPQGQNWLVRVLRISRPRGDGEIELVEPLE